MRVRLVYRQLGTAGQPLFENVDCDTLEFLPLAAGRCVLAAKGRVLFVNPPEVASVTVDGAEIVPVAQPTPVAAA